MNYLDKKPGFRRTYILGSETLAIEGTKWFGGSFRQEFSLRKIKPEPDEHRMADSTFSALYGMPGLVMFMGAVIAGTAIYERSPVGFWTILSAGLAGMIAGFILGGRMQVLIFKSHEEIPLFDIASRGNTPAQFATFAGELRSRIRAAQTCKNHP